MKLVLFAHKPPPHHGQSYMVELLLNALGGGEREPEASSPSHGITCFHVDARYSTSTQDVGQARFGKVLLALRFSAQAIWFRLRFNARNLYYVPAYPARTPIYRDWIVLTLCRPFFRTIIFHWHTAGLGEWMETTARPWERWICQRVYAKPDVSIVLRPFNRRDAISVASRQIEVVPNGIPDPCPDFDSAVRPRRLGRAGARRKLLSGLPLSETERAAAGPDADTFRVLFISLCMREKGLFDTVEAVALVCRNLKDSPLRVRLTVAGSFWIDAERAEFQQRIGQADLQDDGEPVVDYRGFVGGAEKAQLFSESDCLCFPTYMPESFGLVLLEGMAFGLSLVTTNWRDLSELLPPNPNGVVAPRSPEQIAMAIMSHLDRDYDATLREFFLANYIEKTFIERMKTALTKLDA